MIENINIALRKLSVRKSNVEYSLTNYVSWLSTKRYFYSANVKICPESCRSGVYLFPSFTELTFVKRFSTK